MPRHSPYALIRLNFPISDYLKSLGSLRSLELLEFHKTFFRLFLLFAVKRLSFCALINFFPPFGEIVFYPTFYRKTYTNLLIFVLFVCSFFLLFNLFSFIRFSMINQVFPTSRLVWLAQVDSNHRPRAYQARALTTWAMRHYGYSSRFPYSYHWWRWWESNPWPPACRAGALPAELHPHRFGYHSVSLSVTENWTTSRSLFPQYSTTSSSSSSLWFFAYLQIRDICEWYLTFSIERRWSSRTFRYGYLVTT